jgi:multimeric flavodoxin WrbA
MKAAVIYWTASGNTGKVAAAIKETLERAGVDVFYSTVRDARDIDFFSYDLFFLGFPSYNWRPPKPVLKFLDAKLCAYAEEARVVTGSPEVDGKHAVMFCTYSGPHTGVREAIPATLVAGQYFEHLGIPVVAEWHVVGEFHGSLEHSTEGRLGDIRGRPNEQDLSEVKRDVTELLAELSCT